MKISKLYMDDIENIIEFETKRFRMDLRNHILYNKDIEFIITCMPAKTGNNTVKKTLTNYKIPYFHLMHMPASFDKQLFVGLSIKLKIITAIRDPIMQNLSGLYQQIANLHGFERRWNTKLADVNNLFKNGGDAQQLFDIWCEVFANNESNCNDYTLSTFNIEYFFNLFKTSILDISKYPFDKEKGYTIIKEGNIEVFVYQLEKMNNIAKEMSDWIGQTSFDEWDMGNVAEEKWIANSYKQAQIDITFSKEYFDKCYNDPWVKHFYSDEDIGKFKDRWRPHIKN